MKYIVYGLEDPRDGSLFYVGKSCSGLSKAKRHLQKWSLSDHNPDKNSRILDILNSGDKPRIKILAVGRSKEDLYMKETVLIRTLSKKMMLLNRTNNRARANSKEDEGKKAKP